MDGDIEIYGNQQSFATEGDMYESITGHRSTVLDGSAPPMDTVIDGISVVVESDDVAPPLDTSLDDRIAALKAELAELKAMRDAMFP